MGTGSYLAPRLIRAGQVNLTTGLEPRRLSDIINFSQTVNISEQQYNLSRIVQDQINWENALRTIDRYAGTGPILQDACSKYSCYGGIPIPTDLEVTTIPSQFGVSGMAINVNRLYATIGSSNIVEVLDTNLRQSVANITVGQFPNGIAANTNTNRIYVANHVATGTVSVINGATFAVVATISVGSFPNTVAVNPSTNQVYVTTGSNTVSVINGATNTVTTNVTVGINPVGIAVNSVTNSIYVANGGSGTISVIGGATNTVTTTITLGYNGQFDVAVNQNTNRVYVTNDVTNTVLAIDGNTNAVLATIPVAPTPFGVAVNPSTNRIYATEYGLTGAVAVINGITNSVIPETTAVIRGPQAVVANSATNTTYVGGDDFAVSVLQNRLGEVRDGCAAAGGNCVVVHDNGTLFPNTSNARPVNLYAVSLYSANQTNVGTQMSVTIICETFTTNPGQTCSALYVDGNIWSPAHQSQTKGGFVIVNAAPYFYLQWHWWDFSANRIVVWGYWFNGSQKDSNWYWGVYWWWRTYVNYRIGIWLPWWWWQWHWTYWQYWSWWGTAFQT